jgi:hypothetical protein
MLDACVSGRICGRSDLYGNFLRLAGVTRSEIHHADRTRKALTNLASRFQSGCTKGLRR